MDLLTLAPGCNLFTDPSLASSLEFCVQTPVIKFCSQSRHRPHSWAAWSSKTKNCFQMFQLGKSYLEDDHHILLDRSLYSRSWILVSIRKLMNDHINCARLLEIVKSQLIIVPACFWEFAQMFAQEAGAQHRLVGPYSLSFVHLLSPQTHTCTSPTNKDSDIQISWWF
jgi:hypothetical protein